MFHRNGGLRRMRIWLTALSLFLSVNVLAVELTGRVVAVQDGDTVTVLDGKLQQHRIRLAGIDAPEKKMPFGARSKQSLSELVYGRQVEVIGSKIDRYGRLVGKIMVGGRDANLAQVTSGMAWHYKKYQKEQPLQDRLDYAAAEDRARAARRGLWADLHPIPPWDWRKGSREQEGHLAAGRAVLAAVD